MKVVVQDWGLIRYQEALVRQEDLMQEVIAQKLLHAADPLIHRPPINYLVLCEHPPVFTLGNNGKQQNLLWSEEHLSGKGIELVRTRRGGDITYHGPGQQVGYPIIDLDQYATDLHKYLRLLEETIIRTLAVFGLKAGRVEGLTGVWMDEKGDSPRKICAMGVRCSRWVTQHGFALNVNTDLTNFNGIIPCGIKEYGVTSMQAELSVDQPMGDVKRLIVENFLHLTGED